MRREQAFQGLANALCMGLGKDAVVVLGDKNVTGGRWYRPLPHKKLLNVLARTTNVVVVGEYYSSKKCCWCSRLKESIRGNAWVGEGSRKKVSALVVHSCWPHLIYRSNSHNHAALCAAMYQHSLPYSMGS